MIKSFSIQKSSSKPPNVFVVPALKSPTKKIFGNRDADSRAYAWGVRAPPLELDILQKLCYLCKGD